MNNPKKLYEKLVKKLDKLSDKQRSLHHEIIKLRQEITSLRPEQDQAAPGETAESAPTKTPGKIAAALAAKGAQIVQVSGKVDEETLLEKIKRNLGAQNAEEFIGRAIVSVIGIMVVVLGVAFGVKYAIEHGWINPLTRVILGYLAGSLLLGLALYLKKNYHNFSASLLSGAMAVYYIVTYMAYRYYELIPNPVAYGLMLLFTVFTTTAAIYYNRQIIAVIGFLGAYGVPFLLSTDSGNYPALFTYIALINTGILILSFLRYWRILFELAFYLTWGIFLLWYVDHQSVEILTTAMIFSAVFFALFYATFLAYKLYKGDGLRRFDAVMALLNAFIFYGIGYDILEYQESTAPLLGLFTLANAVVHFVVSLVIYSRKERSEPLFFLISALVLVFLTIAVPVQFDGVTVSIIWSAEAIVLFILGRVFQVASYEKLSLPIFATAFFRSFLSWGEIGDAISGDAGFTAFLNPWFFSMAFSAAAFAGALYFIYKLKKRYVSIIDYPALSGIQGRVLKLLYYSLPYAAIITLYFLFYTQLYFGFEALLEELRSTISDGIYFDLWWRHSIYAQKAWLINYTLAFFSAMALVVHFRIKKSSSQFLSLAFLGLALVIGVFQIPPGSFGLLEDYLNLTAEEILTEGADFAPSAIFLTHYFSYLFIAGALISAMICRQGADEKAVKIINLAVLGFTLYFSGSELLYLATLAGVEEASKFILTIFGALFALWPMVWGIIIRQSYLRFASLGLLAAVLAKLFFYDMGDVSTIWRTIILLAVGALLLVTSFLYNKYKSRIFPEE